MKKLFLLFALLAGAVGQMWAQTESAIVGGEGALETPSGITGGSEVSTSTNMKMQFGASGVTWKSGSNNNETWMRKDQGDNLSSNNLNNNVPIAGYYYKFIPQVSGTLTAYFRINATNSKTAKFYDGDGNKIKDDVSGASVDVTYEDVALTVGKVYYVYATGTGDFWFKGYTFTPEVSASKGDETSYDTHTWNFGTDAWADSETQLTGYSDWTYDSGMNAYVINNPNYTNEGLAIDALKGLRFSLGYMQLSKSGFIFVNSSTTISVPVKSGYVVRFNATGNGNTITGSGAVSGAKTMTAEAADYEWTATADGTASFNFSGENAGGGAWIYLISVTDPSAIYTTSYTTETKNIRGSEKPYKGTFTFLTGGKLEGGTVIQDVPGIKLTIGASGDKDWQVMDNTSGGSGYKTVYAHNNNAADRYKFTSGCFYKFEPYVNGYLTVDMQSRQSNVFICSPSASIKEWKDLTMLSGEKAIEVPLVAGETYYLCAKAGGIFLHAFSFQPTFLVPEKTVAEYYELGTAAEQSADFDASLSTDKGAYPKLIGSTAAAGQGFVSFSGDRSLVSLTAKNEVELLDYGTDIEIQGKVMHYDVTTGKQLSDNVLYDSYLLNANVLKLATRTEDGEDIPDTETKDNAFDVELDGLTDGKYYFRFNQNVAKGSGKITLKQDDGDEVDVTSSCTVSEDQILVPVTAAEGSTFRITLYPGSVVSSTNSEVGSAKVVRTFSFKGDIALWLKYPTGLATVGTSIVVQAEELNSRNQHVGISEDDPVYGTIYTLDDNGNKVSTGITILATYENERIIFKPTAALEPNTNYVLNIPGNTVYMKPKSSDVDKSVVQKAHDFYFTTGAATGTRPQMVSQYPTNDPEGDNPITETSGRVEVVFDQLIDIENYSTVYVTPLNGSESTLKGNTTLTEGSLHRTADGKGIYIEWSGSDDLKYDVLNEVVIPVNVVSGAGGLPNSEPITFRFKRARKEGASATDSKPHTWNFNNMSEKTMSDLIDASKTSSKTESKKWQIYASVTKGSETKTGQRIDYIQDVDGKPHSYSADGKTDNGEIDMTSITRISNYVDNRNLYNEQGETPKITDGIIQEMGGLRISLASMNSTAGRDRMRFNPVSGNVDVSAKKFRLQLVGGTHYLTIPQVPENTKLYFDIQLIGDNGYFNINSEPVAEFAEDSRQDAENSFIGKIGRNLLLEVDVKKTDDVVFCLKDVTFNKIVYATYDKRISAAKYATNAETYDTDFNLINEIGRKIGLPEVKPYYVSGYSSDEKGGKVTLTRPQDDYVKAGQGFIVNSEISSETYFPMFTTDVNTSAAEPDENLLTGVTEDDSPVTLGQKTGDKYNYVLSNSYIRVQAENEQDSKVIGNGTGLGFYLISTLPKYAQEMVPHEAYMQLSSRTLLKGSTVDNPDASSAQAKLFVSFIFEDDIETTGISKSSASIGQENDAIFNLQGVKVSRPAKGIYVRNGKKVVIK